MRKVSYAAKVYGTTREVSNYLELSKLLKEYPGTQYDIVLTRVTPPVSAAQEEENEKIAEYNKAHKKFVKK